MYGTRSWFVPIAVISCGLVAGCSEGGSGPSPSDPGALVRVTMSARVGVLLDELPPSHRDRVAAALVAESASFWTARAEHQIKLTVNRLAFRNFFYEGKLQLPLPPQERWTVSFNGAPKRGTVDGHDVVVVDYTLESMLLSDRGSPAQSEPALRHTGGSWDEPFVLPVDPEQLLARTGLACMDETDLPANNVDEADAYFFYNHDCTGGASTCHVTAPAPEKSCNEALASRVGRVDTSLHFERIAWDARVADEARVSSPGSDSGADLAVVRDGLENHRITYRYFEPSSCALAEKCVGGSGWRRLVEFDSSVKNVGNKPVHIGDVDYYVTGSGSPLSEHNVYEYSACHNHYHFRFYGDFSYGEDRGDKRAFCLLTTQRYFNDENTATATPYATCEYQGISRGWGDDYLAGYECQWVDVTDVDTSQGPVTRPLTFEVNPDDFLCEGTPVLEANGEPTFEPTDLETPAGEPIDRPVCDFSPGYEANNSESVDVTLPPKGGAVTEPCDSTQVGPLRDCGFIEGDAVSACVPGAPVTLHCTHGGEAAAPQAVRICEGSHVLGAGIPCTARAALAAGVVEPAAGADLTFTCPVPRGADEPGGTYAVYRAAAFGADAAGDVTCADDVAGERRVGR